jgi:hypothetical protein
MAREKKRLEEGEFQATKITIYVNSSVKGNYCNIINGVILF